MSKLISTLTERITHVKPLGINNFQSYYELTVLFISML